MKKAIFLFLISILLITMLFFLTDNNVSSKSKLIIDNLFEEYTKSNSIDNVKAIIVSLSDGEKKAQVFTYNTIDKDKIVKDISDKYRMDMKWVKIDFVLKEEPIDLSEFAKVIKNTKKYYFNKGLIITNDRKSCYLLPEELNMNDIIDYGGAKINILVLNDYLENKGEKNFGGITELHLFESKAYFYDDNEKEIVELIKTYNGLNTRKKYNDLYEKKGLDLNPIFSLENTKNDMTFTYQLNPIRNMEFNEYTIIRHSLAVQAELLGDFEENKEKIDSKIDYILNQIIEKDESTLFIKEDGDNELKLGASSLACSVLCDYYNKIKDNEDYSVRKEEIYEKMVGIGKGILYFQKNNGGFNHVLYEDTFLVKDRYRVDFYDGEAVYGLCKLYKITSNNTYLDAGKKAMDYFYNEGYMLRGDHWIEYALRELLSIEFNEKYVEMANENAQKSIERIKENKLTYSDFETIVQLNSVYKLLESEGYLNKVQFDVSKFKYNDFDMVLNKAKALFSTTYFFPETAIYLDEPRRYVGLFFVREDGFRVRIDDVAHSLIACYELNF